jgi:hypothetical protein BACCOPRO_00195
MKTLFNRRNYGWMGLGCVLIVTGFLLMAGPESADSRVFSPEIFSVRRIGVAPVVALAGFLLILVGICLPPSDSSS